MATLYSYPLGIPLRSDLIIGTKLSLPTNDDLPITQNYSIGSILDLVVGATGAQSLQQVTNVGQVGGVSISTSNVKFSGQFLDSAGTVGTNGQILTSDAAGKTVWATTSASNNYYVTAASFATATGVLTISGNNALVGATVDLDGRYVSSLTTTGTTGASTFNAATGILNVPNYTNSGGTVAGADTQIQYNDSAAFGAGSFFTTNKTSKVDIVYELGLVGDGTNQGLLKLYCEAGTPHYVGIKGPLHSGGASYTLQLPNTLPSVANQILESNASGDLSWIATPSGTVTGTGTATRIAFWSSGSAISSDADFAWDNTNKRLGIGTIFPVSALQVVGGNNSSGPSAHRFQVTSSFGSSTSDNSSQPGIQLGYQNKSDVTYSDDNTYKTITPNLGVVAGGIGGIGGGASAIATATLGSNVYGSSAITNLTFSNQSVTKIGMVVTYSTYATRVYGDGTAAQIYIVSLDMASGAMELSESIYADAGSVLTFSYPAGVGVNIYQPAVVDGTYDAGSNYTWYDNPGWYQAARFDQFGGVGFGQGLEQGDTEIGTVTLAGAATRAGAGGITTGGLNPISSTKLKFINRYTDNPGTYQERQASISLNYVGSTYGDLELNPSGGSASSLSKIKFVGYGSGNKTGTATYNLSVDSAGKIIETASPSTSLLKTAKNSFPDSDIKVGGTLTFTMPNVPVGKQLLMQNCLFYLDHGGTSFNAPVGYTAFLSFNDGFGSTIIQIPAAQSFFNSTKDTMQIASSINYPATIGDVVITGGGTMELVLPAGASSPSTGNGELYISIEYKEIATGSAFTL